MPSPETLNFSYHALNTETPLPTLASPKTLSTVGMSRASQILPFLPFGSSTLWAWSKDGRFPAPVKLSPTITAWHNTDVLNWLHQLNSPSDEIEASND